MSRADRLRQLRELAGRLELLPASEERDRMLTKVRARVVDVDTGDSPGQFVAARPARRRAVDARRAEPTRAKPSTGGRARPSRPGDPVATLASSDELPLEELLSLAEPASGVPPRGGHGAWERGLRG